MNSLTGILFALGALVGWGFGDFSIQRTARAVGRVRALFYIGAFGAIVLLPFVWNQIPAVLSDVSHWPLLIFIGILIVVTALLDFQGLKLGKLSVIMPIEGIELVVTALLAGMIIHERGSWTVYGLMLIVILGLAFMSIESIDELRHAKWERGVAYALAGAIGLGISNFTIGLASREISPLFTIWLTNVACMFGSAAIMLMRRRHFAHIRNDFKLHFGAIVSQCFFDNAAWLCFAYAVTYIPIGIATAMSEGYLALGTLLGVVVNREKLHRHQYFGIAMTLAGVISLAYLTGR